MIFDVLIKKMVDAGLGEPGKSLFVQAMGAEVMVGTVFKTPLTGIAVDHYIEGRFISTLQAIVRHTDPVLGMELANKVIAALRVQGPEVHELPSGRTHISLFEPLTMPIQFPRLEGNGLEFSIQFRSVFVTKPAWVA